MTEYLRPHFFPAGRLLMLHLFGTVMAIAGLIPTFFARGDRRTVQRHLGALFINALTLVQHAGDTFALTLEAATRHGLRLVAAAFIGIRPHSPAASAHPTKYTRNKQTNGAVTFSWDAIFFCN